MGALLRQQGIAKFLPTVCSVRLIMKEEPFKAEGGKLLDLLLPKSSKRDYNRGKIEDKLEQSNLFQR